MADIYDFQAAQEAGKSPVDNKYDKMFAEEAQRNQQVLSGILDNAIKTTPETASKNKELSKSTGLPQDFVARNNPDVSQMTKIRQIQSSLNMSPVLKQQMLNPDFAAVAHDDVDVLAAIERHLKGFKKAPEELFKGLGGSFNAAASGVNTMIGGIPTLYDMAASKIKGKPETAAEDWWFSHMVDPLVKRQPVYQTQEDATIPEKAFNIAGNLMGLLAQIALTGGEKQAADVTAKIMPIAEKAGNAVTHAARTMAFPAVTGAVNTGRDVYKETGDIQTALNAATMEYATMTGIGLVPLSAEGGIMKRMVSGFSSGALIGESSRVGMNIVLPPELQQDRSIENLIYAGLTGSMLGAVMGPRPSFSNRIRDVHDAAQKSEQARRDGELLDNLQALVNDTKLQNLDPESLNAYMQAANVGGVKSFFIDPIQIEEALKRLSPQDQQYVNKSIKDLQGKISEAKYQSNDVQIPFTDFVSKLSKSPIAKELLPKLKTSPDAFTLEESGQFTGQQDDIIIEQAFKAIEDHQNDTAWKESADKVETQILDKLNDVARFTPDVNQAYAALQKAYYQGIASQLGIKPDEAFSRYPIDVSGEGGQGVGELSQSERGFFSPDTNTITLLKNANLTTFLHESGHQFFENTARIASLNDAPDPIKQDMGKLLDWFGIESIDKWNSMNFEEKRPYHEQFAEGFEKYLFEGKAPSLEIRGVFQRFRAWLLTAYQSLRNLKVELSDEVRGVFDRMLATDEAIKAAQDASHTKPLYDTKPEGMDQDAWDAYQVNARATIGKATDDLNARSLANMKWLSNAKSRAIKELQKVANAKRSVVRNEVSDEVLSDPVYQARSFLEDGTLPDIPRNQKQRRMLEQISLEGNKLSLSILKDMYGDSPAAPWRYLKTGKRGFAIADGGSDPEMVAELFGFRSADEMIKGILEAPTAREIINRITDQRMMERYGDLTDPVSLERAAEEAIHSRLRAKVLATELNILDKGIGKRDTLAAAKRYAEDYMSRQIVDEIKQHKYVVAESKAGRDAESALKKGDIEEAIKSKRAQIVNNTLAKAALDAQNEIDKAVARMNKLGRSKSIRKKMRGDFLEQLDDLLGRFDLRKSTTRKERAQSLRKWIDKVTEENAAVKPEISDQWLNEGYKKSYKDMTLEEFRGLKDTVAQLEMLARREQDMYQAIRNQTFAEEKDSILKELTETHPEAFNEDGSPKGFDKPYTSTLKQKFGRVVEKFDADMLNLENLIQIVAGGRFGRLHESIMQRVSDRADWKITKMQQLGEHLKPYLDAYSYRERARFGKHPIRIDEINDSLTKEQIITTALYYGNAEGRQRLMGGHGWGDREINAIIKHLDARDWALADAFWRMMDEMVWPDLEALNKRTTGSAPPKVAAIPFDTPHGKARGGYWLLVYDADLSVRQQRFDLETSVEDMLGGGAWGARTRQGASKARMEELNRRLVLDFSGMNSKLGETIHDIAFREAVADTYRLLSDAEIRKSIDGIIGPEVSKAMERRIRDIAAQPYSPQSRGEKLLFTMRQNSLVAIMGYSVKTALVNFTGIAPAAARVPVISLSREVATFANPYHTKDVWNFVMENSEYMRNRSQDFDRDIHQAVKKISVKRSIKPDLATAMSLISIMDRAVAVPVWRAAFKEAINGRIKGIESADHARSVKYADHIVRQTQGSGRTVDLSHIQTGSEAWKSLTMFYSYFNAQLGLLARSAQLNYEKGDGMAAAKMAADFASIIVVPAMASALLYNHCSSKESFTKCFGRETALYTAGFLPIFRDVAVAAWNYSDPDAPHYGYRMSPLGAAFDAIAQLPAATAREVTGNEKPADAKRVLMGTSYLFGLPGLQMWRTFHHLGNVYEGKSEFNPWYAIMGEPRKE